MVSTLSVAGSFIFWLAVDSISGLSIAGTAVLESTVGSSLTADRAYNFSIEKGAIKKRVAFIYMLIFFMQDAVK